MDELPLLRPGVGIPHLRGIREPYSWDWRNKAERFLVNDPELKDVQLYPESHQTRRAAVNGLLSHLEAFRPQVLIAHSLGSIVALEALCLSSQQPQLLITLRAPLSWPGFIEAWSPEARSCFKARRLEWLNFVDISDSVTAFLVPPKSPYVGARHVVVNNDHFSGAVEREHGWTNNHRVTEYLRHPSVADAITAVSRKPR
jgi:pimeloyl-ACP methyl ester carboxylesterase